MVRPADLESGEWEKADPACGITLWANKLHISSHILRLMLKGMGFLSFYLRWEETSQTPQLYNDMTDRTNDIRNGVDRHVGPYQACGTPGPEPRPGPPLATGSHSRRKYGPGTRRKSNKATGRPYTLHDHQQHQETVLRGKRLSKSINIVHVNICGGLMQKKIVLANLFKTQMIHVALLQETQHKQDMDLHISGYTAYPCECAGCQGIITYIRNDIDGDVTHLTRAQPTDVQKVTIWHSEKKYTLFHVGCMDFIRFHFAEYFHTTFGFNQL